MNSVVHSQRHCGLLLTWLKSFILFLHPVGWLSQDLLTLYRFRTLLWSAAHLFITVKADLKERTKKTKKTSKRLSVERQFPETKHSDNGLPILMFSTEAIEEDSTDSLFYSLTAVE